MIFSIRHQASLVTELGSLHVPRMRIGINESACACLQPTAMMLPLYSSLCARLFYLAAFGGHQKLEVLHLFSSCIKAVQT